MKPLLLSVLFIVVGYNVSAQKVTVEGDLGFLKDQTSINTKFIYKNLIIGVDKTEAQYVKEKVAAWNEKEGRGDQWEDAWYLDRESIYEPAFRKTLLDNTGINAKDKKAPYTLILKTYQMEPGWSGGVIGCRANITADAIFVESADTTKVLAIVHILEAEGKDYNGGDFETGRRVRQAYVTAAEYLSFYIKKARKKAKKKS